MQLVKGFIAAIKGGIAVIKGSIAAIKAGYCVKRFGMFGTQTLKRDPVVCYAIVRTHEADRLQVDDSYEGICT